MKVHEDYSHCDMEAVREGLLSVRVYSFRLEMYISEEQKKVNRETAGRLTREQWAERCFQRRKEAGKSVTGIMKHIAAQFRVGQWDKPWNAPGPNDLWFWCGDDGRGGRDLSYVTLKVEYATHKEDAQKLNPKDTVERMIRFLNGNPAADIEATIQYETIDNAPMIRIRAMENFMRLYKGKVSYNLMQGRVVYVNNQYYFMKSRAKSKGYALSELEVCRLVAAYNHTQTERNKTMNKNSKSNTKGAELMPTPKSIPAAKLTGAAWNVHSKEKKTDEDFKGLVASIKSQGLIQRVAVRAMPNGEYQIIDGHRRTQAAVAAGLSDIPCDVYYDMKDADAQVRTVTANAQRTQSDPLLEAELYELLAKSGKTQKEVAAVVGQSERYVARRIRLIALIPEWRKTVKESGDVSSVSFLESLAAYSPELQREAHAAFEEGDIGDDEDDVIDWLKGRVMSLKDAPFCTKDCANCPFNTANNALLFAGMFDDENARCEKRTCFVGKWNAETDAQIEKLKASGTAVKEVKNKWDIPCSYDAKSQKDKKHTVPYVYEDGQLRTIVWAQPEKKSAQTTAAKPAQTSAEKKAAKEKREKHLAWFRARRSARDKANAALHATGVGNVFEKIVRECVGTPRFNEWVISYFAKYGPLHETWSSDDQNAALVGMAGDKLLKDFGLDFTEAELTAILSEDPDNAK